jgi:hypothetical protein
MADFVAFVYFLAGVVLTIFGIFLALSFRLAAASDEYTWNDFFVVIIDAIVDFFTTAAADIVKYFTGDRAVEREKCVVNCGSELCVIGCRAFLKENPAPGVQAQLQSKYERIRENQSRANAFRAGRLSVSERYAYIVF